MPTEIDHLAELIADARQLPPALLPRPRGPRPAPDGRRAVIDLTGHELHIPATTISLVEGYDYGA